MKYQTQKIAAAYWYVALALFAAQITFGLVVGYIYVQPNFLSELVPFIQKESACWSPWSARGAHPSSSLRTLSRSSAATRRAASA